MAAQLMHTQVMTPHFFLNAVDCVLSLHASAKLVMVLWQTMTTGSNSTHHHRYRFGCNLPSCPYLFIYQTAMNPL
jgi:hypothetical protein